MRNFNLIILVLSIYVLTLLILTFLLIREVRTIKSNMSNKSCTINGNYIAVFDNSHSNMNRFNNWMNHNGCDYVFIITQMDTTIVHHSGYKCPITPFTVSQKEYLNLWNRHQSLVRKLIMDSLKSKNNH